MAEDDFWLEPKEYLWIPIIALLVAIPLFAAWINAPALAFRAEATLSTVDLSSTGNFFSATSTPENAEEETLKIRQRDVQYLNRLFKESDVEQAFCGLKGGDDTMRIWKADTINASEDTIWYNTNNCPSYFDSGDKIRTHFHPSGNLILSDTDKETYREKDLKYSCIVGGIMTEEDGKELKSFACWELEERNGEEVFVRVPVEVNRVA